jgi:excisionase family DNA binding protein
MREDQSSMGDSYVTLEAEKISLGRLTGEERRFLGQMVSLFKNGGSYLDFENAYMDPGSVVFRHAKRLGTPVEGTPLYQVCEDLARRLGIRQGFLVKEEVVRYQHTPEGERRELTTGEVAKLAGCTHEAVRKAIRTGRLRGRRVGYLSLIWDKDAEAFANGRRLAAQADKGHRA